MFKGYSIYFYYMRVRASGFGEVASRYSILRACGVHRLVNFGRVYEVSRLCGLLDWVLGCTCLDD